MLVEVCLGVLVGEENVGGFCIGNESFRLIELGIIFVNRLLV